MFSKIVIFASKYNKVLGYDKENIRKQYHFFFGRYIDLLEKCYIVYRLPSYSANLRNELKFSRKVYFWDNGIRNAVIGNFSILEMRPEKEKGALWENYVISERMKRNAYTGSYAKNYFWRTTQQKEIDYIETIDGTISAFEFKWNPSAQYKYPKQFMESYPQSSFQVITPANIEEFLI